MENLVKDLSSPIDSNFIFSMKEAVIAFFANSQKQIEESSRDINNLNPELAFYLPEFDSLVYNKFHPRLVSKESLQLNNALLQLNFGVSDSISLHIVPDDVGIRIFGKKIFQEFYIEGDSENVKIDTDSKSDNYVSKNFGVLGKRWLNNDRCILKNGSAAPIIISDGHLTSGKINNVGSINSRELERNIDYAISELINHAPEYAIWIMYILREVYPLKRLSKNRTESLSSLYAPGHISITSEASIAETISMLVHETSHLYFHFLHMFLPLFKPGCKEIYSCIKKMKRPADKVLLGYHAFVNVYVTLKKLLMTSETSIPEPDMLVELSRARTLSEGLEVELLKHVSVLDEKYGLVFFQTIRKLFHTYKSIS